MQRMEERLLEDSNGDEAGEEEEETEERDREEESVEEDEEGSTMAQLKFIDPILPDENHEVDSVEAVDDAEDDPLESFLEHYGVWDGQAALTRLSDVRNETGERKLQRSNGQHGSERLSGGSALQLRINASISGDDPLLTSSAATELRKPTVEVGEPSTSGRLGVYTDDEEQDLLTLQLATRTPNGIDRRVVHNDDFLSPAADVGSRGTCLEDVSRESPRVEKQVLGGAGTGAGGLTCHAEKCSCVKRSAAGLRSESDTRVWLHHVLNPADTVAGSDGGEGAHGKVSFSTVVTPAPEENSAFWKQSSVALQVADGKLSDFAGQCTCGYLNAVQGVISREPASNTGPQQQFVGGREPLELNLFPESGLLGLEKEDKVSFGSVGDHGLSNGKVMRDVMNRSTSNVFVRTGTSLERQYSNGSTSTVESPVLFVKDRKERAQSRAATKSTRATSNPPRLSFSFPGWTVDMGRGKNCTSVVNRRSSEHAVSASGMPASKRSRETLDASADSESLGSQLDSNLGEQSPISELPDEILMQVMRRLGFRDLCLASQACKRWHDVGLQNELWEPFLGNVDHGLCSDASSDILPRWVCKKSLCMSEGVREQFNVFSKGYDFLRQALHFWWHEGSSNSKYSSKRMHSLIRKLTENDWSLLYEALGVTFTDRTDRIANELERSLRPMPSSSGSKPGGLEVGPERMKCGQGGRLEYESNWRSRALEDVSELGREKGKRLWEALLRSWKRYKCWLQLIFTHCQDLNQCVSFERARSPNLKIQTPTLFDKGLICFRSQVVLKYGLRSLLQSGFLLLTDENIRDSATEHDVDLLRSCHHFLQELDVMDDCTLPERYHTQTKLRHCFPKALSVNCKLALHMKDKWNQM